MGYGVNYEIKVRARLANCKEIGAAWVNAILAEVPTANEALAELNSRDSTSSERQFLNWGEVWEIEGDDLVLYYDFGATPCTINLWWGEGMESIPVDNKFNSKETIARISKMYPNSIFNIVEKGIYSGDCSHDEYVMFAGEVVATVGGR